MRDLSILAAVIVCGLIIAHFAPHPPGGSTLARIAETWIWHQQHDPVPPLW